MGVGRVSADRSHKRKLPDMARVREFYERTASRYDRSIRFWERVLATKPAGWAR